MPTMIQTQLRGGLPVEDFIHGLWRFAQTVEADVKSVFNGRSVEVFHTDAGPEEGVRRWYDARRAEREILELEREERARNTAKKQPRSSKRFAWLRSLPK